jgi:beta-glucanase (GH16 family)
MQNNNSTNSNNQDRINELICGIENCTKYLEVHALTTTKVSLEIKWNKVQKIQKYTQELKSLVNQ